jgi:hypothetical protein
LLAASLSSPPPRPWRSGAAGRRRSRARWRSGRAGRPLLLVSVDKYHGFDITSMILGRILLCTSPRKITASALYVCDLPAASCSLFAIMATILESPYLFWVRFWLL